MIARWKKNILIFMLFVAGASHSLNAYLAGYQQYELNGTVIHLLYDSHADHVLTHVAEIMRSNENQLVYFLQRAAAGNPAAFVVEGCAERFLVTTPEAQELHNDNDLFLELPDDMRSLLVQKFSSTAFLGWFGTLLHDAQGAQCIEADTIRYDAFGANEALIDGMMHFLVGVDEQRLQDVYDTFMHVIPLLMGASFEDKIIALDQLQGQSVFAKSAAIDERYQEVKDHWREIEASLRPRIEAVTANLIGREDLFQEYLTLAWMQGLAPEEKARYLTIALMMLSYAGIDAALDAVDAVVGAHIRGLLADITAEPRIGDIFTKYFVCDYELLFKLCEAVQEHYEVFLYAGCEHVAEVAHNLELLGAHEQVALFDYPHKQDKIHFYALQMIAADERLAEAPEEYLAELEGCLGEFLPFEYVLPYLEGE